MHDQSVQLIKMANQIGTFFEAQTPSDAGAATQAIAAHLKSFWAPSMRLALVESFDQGKAQAMLPIVATAVRNHRAKLMPDGGHMVAEAKLLYPQGGGDAG